MDLIVYQMVQLQIVHVSDGNRAVEIFSCTAVTQTHLTVSGDRHAFPEFSVLTVVRQILQHFRKQLFFMLCLKLFPA